MRVPQGRGVGDPVHVDAVDPATGRVLAAWPASTASDVHAALDAATRVQREWAERTAEARAATLCRAAELLRSRAMALTLLLADEIGRPVREGRAELDAGAAWIDYVARHAGRHLAPERIAAEAPRAYVRHEPVGVVLALLEGVTVYADLARATATALAAGNGVVVRAEGRAAASALAFVQVLEAAGVPAGLVGTVRLAWQDATTWLSDARGRGTVAFGSIDNVRVAATEAARHGLSTWTETPTSDALIVLGDGDLEDAVEASVTGRFEAAGQARRGVRRIVVVASVHERFERALAERVAALRVGPPRDASTDLGPLLHRATLDELATRVEAAVLAGARRVAASRFPEGPGSWCPALLVAGATPGMALFDEPVEGPVGVIAIARDDEEALAWGAPPPRGGGLALFTRDAARGEALALATTASPVAVNGLPTPDPRLEAAAALRALTRRRPVQVS